MAGRSTDGFRTFEDLECWKACRVLRRWVSEQVRKLPREEKYRLGDQMIRAGRSTTANIAEGYGRFHYQETVQFCRQSKGSAYEILDHLIAAEDDGLVDKVVVQRCRELVQQAVLLLNGYIRYLLRRKNGTAE